MKIRLLFYFIFILNIGLFAQKPIAVIAYAEGSEFYITRNNDIINFDLSMDSAEGTELFEGDGVSTLDSTYLEIQIEPSHHFLKISENTSVLLENLDLAGKNSFNLSYGRLRAKVNKLVNNQQFSVQSQSVTAGVRGTDFGFDLIYQPDAVEPEKSLEEARVYCFEGEVAVVDETLENKEPILIKENEMVSLVKASTVQEIPSPPKVERTVMAVEVQEFWTENEFSGQTVAIEIPQELQAFVEPEEKIKKYGVDVAAELAFWKLSEKTIDDLEEEFGDGSGSAVDVLVMIFTLRAGFVGDFYYNYNEIMSIGLETGALWSSMTDLNETEHTLYNIPVFAFVKFNLAPLYFMLYGGPEILLETISAGEDSGVEDETNFDMVYDVGAKLGFTAGNINWYIIAGLVFTDDDDINSDLYMYRYGLGASMKLY